jgi:transposase
MVLFPPGKGGGEGVAHGFKGKGVTIHSLVDGNGMPLAVNSTPANAYEPDQVIPLIDSIHVHTGRPGRSRKCPTLLQADAGYDIKRLRQKLKSRGIQPRVSVNSRCRKKPKRGRPYAKTIDRWKCERTFAWYQRKFRRLVVRWERRSAYWHGFLAFGFCIMWIDHLVG